MMMRTNSIVYLKTDRWLSFMFLISFRLCKEEEEGTKENKQNKHIIKRRHRTQPTQRIFGNVLVST